MASKPYPDLHIIPPTSTHTTTLILLHGTSGNGPDFASSLLSTPIHKTQTLSHLLPNTKLVFPTGRQRYVSVLGKETNAWFNIHDFADRTVGEEGQGEGIAESLVYLKEVVEREVEDVGGNGKRVVMGGFSQGAAGVGVGCLSGVFDHVGLGGWVALGGWLPFRKVLDEAWKGVQVDGEAGVKEVYGERRRVVREKLADILGVETAHAGEGGEVRLWMGHGGEDEKVRLELGVQMRDLMLNLGIRVEMKVYEGLGHWFNRPELADMVGFLEGRWVGLLE